MHTATYNCKYHYILCVYLACFCVCHSISYVYRVYILCTQYIYKLYLERRSIEAMEENFEGQKTMVKKKTIIFF